MALPTLAKSWQFGPANAYINQAIAASGTILTTNRNMLLAIKNSLVGMSTLPWQIRGSSNGGGNTIGTHYDVVIASGAAGPATDRWVTNANLIWAAAGTAHSWVVLRQTGVSATFEVLISCEAASTNGSLLTIYASSLGFSGGTGLARPTAADETTVLAGTSWGGRNAADGAFKLHVEQSTDGQCTRIQLYSASLCCGFILLDKPRAPVTNWSNPFAAMWLSTADNPLANMPVAANMYSAAPVVGRGPIGNMTMFMTAEAKNNINIQAAGIQRPNDISGEYYMPGVGLYSDTALQSGQHGYLYDLWWANTVLTEGSGFPATGSTGQFRVVGDLVIAWPAGQSLQII